MAVAHGEHHGVIQQVALRVEHHDLASRAYARVNAHDTFLPKGRGQKQLPQVLLEDTYRLVVGLLLAQGRELILYRRLHKSFVTVLHSLSHNGLARAEATHVMALQPFHVALVIASDAHPEHAFGLAATHGEKPVRGAAAQLFGEREIIAVFLRLVVVFHLRDDARHYRCLMLEVAAHRLPRSLVEGSAMMSCAPFMACSASFTSPLTNFFAAMSG